MVDTIYISTTTKSTTIKTYRTLLLSFVFILTIFQNLAQADSVNQFILPEYDTTQNSIKHQAWGTYYVVHQFESKGNINLLQSDNTPTGIYADTCDFCMASLEGTAIITTKNGEKIVLNYDRTDTTKGIDCRKCPLLKNTNVDTERLGKIRWKYSTGFGVGVNNLKLIPFRTIAVDKTFIPYGSVVFIPSIRGLHFTDEENNERIHDGYFFAGDTGSAIQSNHLDFFIGTKKINPFKKVITSTKNNLFEIYTCSKKEFVTKIKRYFE